MASFMKKSIVLAIVSTLAIQVSAQADGAGNGQGLQFITGECVSDLDCDSGCCGFNTGLCAGAVVAQDRDGGCGFGDATPNDIAAQAFQTGQDPFEAVQQAAGGVVDGGAGGAANGTAGGATGGAAGGYGGDAPAVNGDAAGNGNGEQFITGTCLSDADCASGCCGFNTGLCAGAVVAQERDGGCGFGDAAPNDDAAAALSGKQKQKMLRRETLGEAAF